MEIPMRKVIRFVPQHHRLNHVFSQGRSQQPRNLQIVNVLTVPLGVTGNAYPSLAFRMSDDLKACAAKTSLYGCSVWYEPVGRIMGVALLHEVHCWKSRLKKYFLIPDR